MFYPFLCLAQANTEKMVGLMPSFTMQYPASQANQQTRAST
jgi:hypothetical protein